MMRHNRQLLIIVFSAALIWSAEPVSRDISGAVDHQDRLMAAGQTKS